MKPDVGAVPWIKLGKLTRRKLEQPTKVESPGGDGI
jgi:hypothetical protein